jgi:hypothetical protein
MVNAVAAFVPRAGVAFWSMVAAGRMAPQNGQLGARSDTRFPQAEQGTSMSVAP